LFFTSDVKAHFLQSSTDVERFRASLLWDHPRMQCGRVYIAPPDHHMRVEDEHVGLFQGPKERHSRPSINTLFRSAAQFYGKNVVGVILTGGLDDGASGLAELKSSGGVAIVQAPEDASHPSMPINAMRRTEVDYCLPLKDIGPLLLRLVGTTGNGLGV